MPYVKDNNSDEDEKTTGEAAVGGSALDSGSQDASQVKTPTGSGNFTNLDQYLQVNPSTMGSQLAGKLNQDVDSAKAQSQQAGNAFKSSVDAGVDNYNQDLSSRVLSSPDTVSAEDTQAFKNMASGAYGGPKDYTDAGYTRKADENAQAGQSEAGRFSLLQDYYGRPGYTQGQTALDQGLVQRDTGAQAAFDAAKAKADQNYAADKQNLLDYNDYATQAANNSRATGQHATADLTDANNQFQTGLSDRYKAALADYNARYLPGLQNQAGGTNVQQIAAPTMASVMTPQEKARYLALSGLSGTAPLLVNQDTEVGGYKPPPTIEAPVNPEPGQAPGREGGTSNPLGGVQTQSQLTDKAQNDGFTNSPDIAANLGFVWSDQYQMFIRPPADSNDGGDSGDGGDGGGAGAGAGGGDGSSGGDASA